ncbi:hypothetical protein [Bradyrhizobium sp. 145]|uniref:hypothetical protein n=1 Tax=Bradyrhizobium sp. 145 TaxID=2782621 RepID=UPI001FF844A2|nr:hypothetical protein [Bradyrhizobium sp. 145]MCK1688276.1 hypothetical protein [Bradyrhizobium sp. 145]
MGTPIGPRRSHAVDNALHHAGADAKGAADLEDAHAFASQAANGPGDNDCEAYVGRRSDFFLFVAL